MKKMINNPILLKNNKKMIKCMLVLKIKNFLKMLCNFKAKELQMKNMKMMKKKIIYHNHNKKR